jgi:hypothetical protein
MRKIWLGLLLSLLALPAHAQSTVRVCVMTSSTHCEPVTSGQPLPVTGLFSATTTGFAPSLAYATCTATGSSCGSTALPTNTGSVVLFNSGTTTVSCTLASGAATALASELQIPASSGLPLSTTYGATTYDHFACIDQSGSTSNVVVASGGSGLPTGWGGGGGSGGGGGAITAASGSYASGAMSSGAYASGSIASGAMVDLGSQADSACSTDNGSCSAIALIKRTNQNVTTLNTTAGSAIVGVSGSAQSSSNPMGWVNINQTTPGTTNGVVVNAMTAADPCVGTAKTNVPISTASGTTALVTGVSAKKIYVCSLALIAPSAVSVSLSEGSSSTCGTSNQAAVIGVATNGTAANGMPLAANGGLTLGNGGGTIAATATAANYLCLFQSGTAQIAGNLTYVQQ